MTPQRVFEIAAGMPPSQEQLSEWEYKSYGRPYTVEARSALTGWDGRTIKWDYISWAEGYAEPGYDNPKRGILFGDWNQCSTRVQSILVNMGYELEWEDEWTTCCECGKAVRTQQNSYSWQPYYVILNECELVCVGCIKEDTEGYLRSIENNHRVALNVSKGIDPEDYGYELVVDDCASGWYGCSDDPEEVSARMREQGHDNILFVITDIGQFEIGFQAWARKEQG